MSKPLQCEKCSKVCKSASALKQHITKQHKKKKTKRSDKAAESDKKAKKMKHEDANDDEDDEEKEDFSSSGSSSSEDEEEKEKEEKEDGKKDEEDDEDEDEEEKEKEEIEDENKDEEDDEDEEEDEDEDEKEDEVDLKLRRKKGKNIKFAAGQELEGENDNPDFPLYFDTIQRVKYVGISENDPESHLCSMLAFEDRPIYEWKTAELHQTRDSNGKDVFEVGEKVHVRLRNRCGFNSRGKKEKKLDHLDAKRGVWVKAKVFQINKKGNSFTVKHIAWSVEDDNKSFTKTKVDRKDIRKDIRKDW